MTFKMFNNKDFPWKTGMLAPIRDPKVSKEVSGTQMVCGNADHWAKNCHTSCLPPRPCPNYRHYWVDFLTLPGQGWVSFLELLFHRRIIWTFWVKLSRARNDTTMGAYQDNHPGCWWGSHGGIMVKKKKRQAHRQVCSQTGFPY